MIPFRGFDTRGDVRIYQHGILPHWRQHGCTYFVTFRQADSLPAAVLREMEADRHQWLRNNGIDPDASNWKTQFADLPADTRREYERLIGITLDKHLDRGYGSCHLKNAKVARMVADALTYFHGERVFTPGDFVVMPNHVHVLLRPFESVELEEILHSIKSYTANQINKTVGKSGEFWQRQSYDHIVRDFEQLEAFQEYVARNPNRAGLSDDEFVLYRGKWKADE